MSPSWPRSETVRSGANICPIATWPAARDHRPGGWRGRLSGYRLRKCLAVARRGLALRRRRLRHLRLCRALLIERDEIDGIEQERREATVAHRGSHDLACKWEQQARALDHDERLQGLR